MHTFVKKISFFTMSLMGLRTLPSKLPHKSKSILYLICNSAELYSYIQTRVTDPHHHHLLPFIPTVVLVVMGVDLLPFKLIKSFKVWLVFA